MEPLKNEYDRKIRVLDLFSGIGGFSLGLERTGGFRTVAFCEIEEFPRKVLRKHWPDIPIFEDVRKLHAEDLPEPVDVVCGGYPCQPFSLAGKRKGKDDDRHIWPEIDRLLREFDSIGKKPSWCMFENVAGHVNMGLDQVLSDLESQGYTAWTIIVPACSVDAPHRRDRVWIVANYGGDKHQCCCDEIERETTKEFSSNSGCELSQIWTERERDGRGGDVEQHGCVVADTKSKQARGVCFGRIHSDACNAGNWRQQAARWATEPDVGRVANGVPSRVDRLKSLGNAVVPQVVEVIGRAILEAENKEV